MAPFERAEIYFMDGARSMVERDDYLVPHYRGKPFFDKPVLAYWLMAGSFHLFGFTPEAARLVSVLAALGTLLATVWLGTLLLDRRSAMAAATVLATTLAFMGFGRVAMSDMLLTLWSTLAMALAASALRPGSPSWAVPALGAALGLGFLTKGPVAILLPGLGILLLLWRRRGESLPAKWRGILAAVALFGLLGLGWFLALYRRLGSGPLAYFLQENLERFAGETYDTEREPWYYLSTYLAEGLPWSLFLPVALSCFLRDDPVEPPGAGGSRFLAGWLGLMAVPLSLSRGKIDYYLLPLYPAAALVIGHYFARVPWGRFERVWARAALALTGAGLVALSWAPGRFPAEWLPGAGAQLVLALAAISCAAACLLVAVRADALRVMGAAAAAAALPFLVLAGLFLPAFRAAQPNQAILEDVVRERRYCPDATLVLCEDPARVQRDLLFHARIAALERCDLWSPASSRLPFMLLLGPEERAALSAVPALRVVSEHRYLPATTLTFRGLLASPRPAVLSLVANYATEDPVAETKRKKERKRALRALEDRGEVAAPSRDPRP